VKLSKEDRTDTGSMSLLCMLFL